MECLIYQEDISQLIWSYIKVDGWWTLPGANWGWKAATTIKISWTTSVHKLDCADASKMMKLLWKEVHIDLSIARNGNTKCAYVSWWRNLRRTSNKLCNKLINIFFLFNYLIIKKIMIKSCFNHTWISSTLDGKRFENKKKPLTLISLIRSLKIPLFSPKIAFLLLTGHRPRWKTKEEESATK